MDAKDFFNGKKITVMGVDPEGRAIQAARFLAESGAEVRIVSADDDHDLRNSLQTLADLPTIKFEFKPYTAVDFSNQNFVLTFVNSTEDLVVPIQDGLPVFKSLDELLGHHSRFSLSKVFSFDSFTIDTELGKILYMYSTDAGHAFTHEITVEFPTGADIESIRPAVFALGMAELPSYWKAILAPSIVVKAAALDANQIQFWENLYTKGLGEFFYVNQIDFRNLLHITSDPNALTLTPSTHTGTSILVPFGGGKDSLVTGEMLKEKGKDFSWFELEPLVFGEKLREVSGNTKNVKVTRNKEKNFAPIIELVKAGAPNGHVPITSSYMMSAVLGAEIFGFSDVILSLERSANFGNIEYLGQEINHQYSKSFEFEVAARNYITTYINPNIRLFSLVRPLYEIQIVQKFVEYPKYFNSFISCNRGLKTATWCGECAKCAFMFAALSAFLEPEVVVSIFKKNLYEDATLIPLYTDLIGKGKMKPFDCVGTFDENILALYLSGEQYHKKGFALPKVLTALPIKEGKKHLSMLNEKGEAAIPLEYL